MSSLSWHRASRASLPIAMIPKPIPTTRDPRIYQIAILSTLLIFGSTFLNFDVTLTDIAANLGSALVTQWLCTRYWKLPRFDPRSPLISGLSLTLLLRTDSILLALAAGALAILTKFVLRVNNRHIFNPTNIAIVLLLAAGADVWVSPGQWGSTAVLAFAFGCVGIFVTHRSERSDVTVAFLLAYVSLIFARALWLGDPMAMPVHHLQSGGLFLFAFFMISDPKTTPNSRTGRIIHAVLVATVAIFIQYVLFRQNGILWALALCTLTIPILDRIFPGPSYQWTKPSPSQKLNQRSSS